MPNIRSAKKRMRQNGPRRDRNRQQLSAVRTAVKQVRAADTQAEAQAAFARAEMLLDRAAGKQLVHPNAAARQKSRLTKAIADKK